MLKVKRILSVGRLDETRKSARRECTLTPAQRLALLDELRNQATDSGQPIKRVLEIVRRRNVGEA